LLDPIVPDEPVVEPLPEELVESDEPDVPDELLPLEDVVLAEVVELGWLPLVPVLLAVPLEAVEFVLEEVDVDDNESPLPVELPRPVTPEHPSPKPNTKPIAATFAKVFVSRVFMNHPVGSRARPLSSRRAPAAPPWRDRRLAQRSRNPRQIRQDLFEDTGHRIVWEAQRSRSSPRLTVGRSRWRRTATSSWARLGKVALLQVSLCPRWPWDESLSHGRPLCCLRGRS
jgi:hypothetical protein